MKEDKWPEIVPALSLAIGSLKRPAYKKNATMKVTLKPINILYWSTNNYTQVSRQISTQNDQKLIMLLPPLIFEITN